MSEGSLPRSDRENDVGELRRRIEELEQTNRRLRQTRDRFHERERRFRKLLGDIPGMVYRGRPDWTIEVISRSELVCGYVPKEFLRKEVNWLEIIHPDDRDEVLRQSASLNSQSTSTIQHYRILHKSGDIRWVEDHKASVFDGDGAFCGVDGVAFDITDRKVMEDTLRESEARFRYIFDNAADGFLLANTETGRFSMANTAMCEILGYDQEEIQQLSVRDIHPDDALGEALEAFAKHARGALRFSHEIPVKTKDGRVIYCDINAIPLMMRGEKHLLGVFRDVTVHKELSERLRESEELYRTLVESAGETIARVDADGRFLFMNTTAADRLGGAPQDYVGKTMQDLFPAEIADRQLGSIRAVIRTGRGTNVVVPTVLQGETRWYNTTIEPLTDTHGKITSVLVVGRDIHELYEAQKELEEYRSQMARAEQLASLGTLSATVAHELNQPLTVIQLSLQNCLAELKVSGSEQQVVADLKDCLQEVLAASSIIDRFKGFARYSRARKHEWVSPEDVAQNVIRLWNEAAEKSGLALMVEGLEGLPELYMHHRDMEQLFFSLVENAIQAADADKDQRLLITALAKDSTVELRFADNCGGIAPADLDKILDPFFTTKMEEGGTGLGLSIVDHIVARAGGKLEVENRPGEGVTFVVTLPCEGSR